jgi:hypothetical protein
MRISRTRLTWIIKKTQEEAKKGKKKLSAEALAKKIADYMEANPSCVNPFDTPTTRKRFGYSTVGYGIFNLLGEKYRMGRIEIFDEEANSSYQIDEGTYCMPYEAAAAFEDFIDCFQTDLPIQIQMGTVENCEKECAKALGLSCKEDLRNAEIIEKFQKAQNDKYAQAEGFKNYEEFAAHIQAEQKKP